LSEKSTRDHIHINDTKFRFQSSPYAPIPVEKGGSGKSRFAVEDMVYITGLGWDVVDVYNSGNEFAIAFYKYIEFKEFMGYEHIGLTSKQIKERLNNVWKDNKIE